MVKQWNATIIFSLQSDSSNKRIAAAMHIQTVNVCWSAACETTKTQWRCEILGRYQANL